MFCKFIIIFCIFHHHLLYPSKIPDCKIQNTTKKIQFQVFQEFYLFIFFDWQYFQYRLPNIVVTWGKLLGPLFAIQISQFCDNLSKVVGQICQPTSSFLRRWDSNFECEFLVKIRRIYLMKARVVYYTFYSLSYHSSYHLCCIKISSWSMVNPKARILWRLWKGGWYKAFLQIESMLL